MAGDWIKIRKCLFAHPKVMVIAKHTGLCEAAVVGWLSRIWSWADDATADGHVDSVTYEDVQRVTGAPIKLLASMQEVGWLIQDSQGICFPEYEEHMSHSAKSRAQSQKRKEKQRKTTDSRLSAPTTPPPNSTSRTKRDISVTREEKRRVDIKSVVDDSDADGRGVFEAKAEAALLVGAFKNIRLMSVDRDWIWKHCYLAQTLMPGFIAETAQRIRHREISKPCPYIEKAISEAAKSQGTTRHKLLASVPEWESVADG